MRQALDIIRADREGHCIDYAGTDSVALSVPPHNYFFYLTEGPVDQIHDHMRGYQSVVLKGRVKNTVYRMEGQGTMNMYWTKCPRLCGVGGCCDADAQLIASGLQPVKMYEQVVEVGEMYSMTHDQFHQFESLEAGSITRQLWKPIEKPQTHIVAGPEYLTNKCEPKEFTEDELWEMVYSCL